MVFRLNGGARLSVSRYGVDLVTTVGCPKCSGGVVVLRVIARARVRHLNPWAQGTST